MKDFSLAAVGGKDSMSGTYKNIDVPPTLIAFGFTIAKINRCLSDTLIDEKASLYLLTPPKLASGILDIKKAKAFYEKISNLINDKNVLAVINTSEKVPAIALINAGLGNHVNFHANSTRLLQENIGGFVVQSNKRITFGKLIGKTATSSTIINKKAFSLSKFLINSLAMIESVYPVYELQSGYHAKAIPSSIFQEHKKYPSLNKGKCMTLIPVFPGTNCEFDLRDAFIEAGSETEIFIFNNLNSETIKKSVQQLAKKIAECDILAIPGGFSLGDEPDGSGKFIGNILRLPAIQKVIKKHLKNKKLIIGICNGFQALMASGLLPSGDFNESGESCLTFNKIGRHISTMAFTRIISLNSPWLQEETLNKVSPIPISNGEGNFQVLDASFFDILNAGQIFSVYSSVCSQGTCYEDANLSGSTLGMEGIVSQDGLILGRMGHPERLANNLYQNVISDFSAKNIFASGVKYIKG